MDHTRGSMSSWKYAVGPAVNSSCTDARTVPNHARNPGLSSLLRVGPVHSSEFSYAVGKKGIRSPFACFALWSRGDKGSPLSVTASVSRSGVPSSVRRGVTSCAKYFVLVVLGFWLLLQLVALRTFWTSLGRQLLPTHSRQEGAPPVAGSSPPRSLDPTQARPFESLDSETLESLRKEYSQHKKACPYVGSVFYSRLAPKSRAWLNALAVFEHQGPERLHGLLGRRKDGTPLWSSFPQPPPLDSPDVNSAEELKDGGGFYLRLSNAIPLDRSSPDSRDRVCRKVKYDLQKLGDSVDVSIVITFHNEPASTLLRTLHSILNTTPPPLLREIILINDYSDDIHLLPGGFLDQYTPHLPKTSLVHLRERKGIVAARLEGIRRASAPVIVILDSHVEVNVGWLEPQLQRLSEAPNSIVFPQIDTISPTDFSFKSNTGIGCWLSFNWDIQEQSTLTGRVFSPKALKSPLHAGGLLAFKKDFFLELGGYDTGFTFWGAENVELSFRTWMCGGRLECTPCARVFHLFRQGGLGYQTPSDSLWRNRMRTARIWMDEYYDLAAVHNPYHLEHKNATIGSIAEMEALRERLKCKKNFRWFLKEVDPKHEFQDLAKAIIGLGHIKSESQPEFCLDAMNNVEEGNPVGLFYCHGLLGNQGFMLTREPAQIRLLLAGKDSNKKMCVTPGALMADCELTVDTANFQFEEETGILKWTGDDEYKNTCMQINPRASPEIPSLTWKPCDPANPNQRWAWPPYPSLRYLPEEERRRRGKMGDQSHHEWEASAVRSKLFPSLCLDARRHPDHGSRLGISPCSHSRGSNRLFYTREAAQMAVDVKTIGGDSLCLGYPNRLYICDETDKTVGVMVEHGQRIVWRHQDGTIADSCLAVMTTQSSPTVLQHEVRFVACQPDSLAQLWITDW